MKKKIDIEKIAYHMREIIIALGDNPDREGLKETPMRVAKMYEENFEGMLYNNDEITEMFGKTFEEEDYVNKNNSDFVVVKDIPIFSYFEHHMALMYNMTVSVIYKPADKIIGLSKIARIADMVSKRLQLQERIGNDIAEIIQKATGSEAVGVLINGEHSCIASRGIRKVGSVTSTTTFKGIFETDNTLRQEAILLLQ